MTIFLFFQGIRAVNSLMGSLVFFIIFFLFSFLGCGVVRGKEVREMLFGGLLVQTCWKKKFVDLTIGSYDLRKIVEEEFTSVLGCLLCICCLFVVSILYLEFWTSL